MDKAQKRRKWKGENRGMEKAQERRRKWKGENRKMGKDTGKKKEREKTR